MDENNTQTKPKPNKKKKLRIKNPKIHDNENEIIENSTEDPNITINSKILEVKYTNNSDIYLINGDCLIEMGKIKKNSINCIIADLPYGVSMNNWDSI